jgi:hypothetical protein
VDDPGLPENEITLRIEYDWIRYIGNGPVFFSTAARLLWLNADTVRVFTSLRDERSEDDKLTNVSFSVLYLFYEVSEIYMLGADLDIGL